MKPLCKGVNIRLALATLKGISIEKTLIGKFSYTTSTSKFHTKIWGLNMDFFGHSAVIDIAVHKIGDIIVGFSSHIPTYIQKGFNPCISPRT
jgi:hypothetical protein